MYLKFGILITSILILATLIFAAPPPPQSTSTVWDGVYTSAQATSGQAVYQRLCVECHLENLSGGGRDPQLAGPKWLENWREDNLESLYLKIKNTMPRRSRESLTETETLDVMSYMLSKNGFPEGQPLGVAGLAKIRILRKEGPRPLPNYAQVEAVGCMTKQGDKWTLTQADEPVRSRDTGSPETDMMTRAAAKPLGSRTVALENLIILGGFDPAVHEGHKMVARGALMRRSNAESISVASLNMVGEKCGQ